VPDPFKCVLECNLGRDIGKRWPAMMTAERHEVSLSGLLETLETPRHSGSLLETSVPLKAKKAWRCFRAARTAPLKPKKGLNGPPARHLPPPALSRATRLSPLDRVQNRQRERQTQPQDQKPHSSQKEGLNGPPGHHPAPTPCLRRPRAALPSAP